MALREQPIKKSVVKRETPTTSGSAESGQPGNESALFLIQWATHFFR